MSLWCRCRGFYYWCSEFHCFISGRSLEMKPAGAGARAGFGENLINLFSGYTAIHQMCWKSNFSPFLKFVTSLIVGQHRLRPNVLPGTLFVRCHTIPLALVKLAATPKLDKSSLASLVSALINWRQCSCTGIWQLWPEPICQDLLELAVFRTCRNQDWNPAHLQFPYGRPGVSTKEFDCYTKAVMYVCVSVSVYTHYTVYERSK